MSLLSGGRFSVIIPTLQRAAELRPLVDLCAAHPLVGEVIVVNNAPTPLAWDSSKVRVLQQHTNIYVNAAWNLGVRESTFPLLAILNDDIIFNPSLLEHVRWWLRLPGVGIIGGGPGATSPRRGGRPPAAIPVYKRPNGFGIAMFMRRERYVPVPEQMRIWYGDDWLFYRQRSRNFSLTSAGIETEMSVTSDDFAASPIALADAEAAKAHGVFDGPFVRRRRWEARAQRALTGRIARLRRR